MAYCEFWVFGDIPPVAMLLSRKQTVTPNSHAVVMTAHHTHTVAPSQAVKSVLRTMELTMVLIQGGASSRKPHKHRHGCIVGGLYGSAGGSFLRSGLELIRFGGQPRRAAPVYASPLPRLENVEITYQPPGGRSKPRVRSLPR